jgi:hypothetical protein
MLRSKHLQHRSLFNAHKCAISESGSRPHPEMLNYKTVFAKEIAFAQDGNCRFFACFRDDGYFDPSPLNVEDGITPWEYTVPPFGIVTIFRPRPIVERNN